MNKYTYLLAKKESGELSILLQLGLPLYLTFWMDIYGYHLAHPGFNQIILATHLRTSKSTVQRALAFMNQPII